MSVLTDSEGDGLVDMAAGLMKRYQEAGVLEPKLLYVDRDCCSRKLQTTFRDWTVLVRLDICHFMRRFAIGCASESHALYPVFMSQLSTCIFQWDVADLQRLRDAKKAEFQFRGRCLDRLNTDLLIPAERAPDACEATDKGPRGDDQTASRPAGNLFVGCWQGHDGNYFLCLRKIQQRGYGTSNLVTLSGGNIADVLMFPKC